jgi:RND family efflux transporter MFP subunit
MSVRKVLAFGLFITTLLLRVASAQSTGGLRAITRPSADVTLSFVQPGRIAEVRVREGDVVRAGQVLVRQDDTAEQVLLAQLKAQADDTTQIRASEASLAQKKVDLEKLEIAASRNAATQLEVQHAKLDVTIAELSLEMARFERAQAGRKYEEQKIRVEDMRLTSPVDGRIEKIDIEVGESINAFGGALQVVRIDPLWIDVPVPLVSAVGLKDGMTGSVTFPGSGGTVSEGKVIFVAAVADAASDTLRVRVEVPNKTGRPAGEHVTVAFER